MNSPIKFVDTQKNCPHPVGAKFSCYLSAIQIFVYNFQN